METGGVITAAGMFSQMGEFKPMLNIGSITVAERIIATFKQCGITKIVVVTGYNSDELERHLAKTGVIFLRNELYETTQMFQSACIGLEYMLDKCDQVLFSPVDVPLFTTNTVETLLKCSGSLIIPTNNNEPGHPILLSNESIRKILKDSGEGGLYGAFKRCNIEQTLIEVEDAGILHDADTPNDYQQLLEHHNKQLTRPLVDVQLSKEKPFFDSRVALLLALIDETNSVRYACQMIQLSYSSGWNLINSIEAELGYQLVHRIQGGSHGSKSTLTSKGKELLLRFNDFETEVKNVTDKLFEKYFPENL